MAERAQADQKRRISIGLAGAIAAIGLAALLYDDTELMGVTAARGGGLLSAAIWHLRFFTILSNWAVAVLMSVTTVQLLRRRPLPGAGLFRAVTVYLIVTSVTYELLLRRQWSPRDMQFATDLVFHDIVPALTLIFWLGPAPKQGLRWSGLGWLILFPVAYFTLTIVVGELGGGYPYDFLDAGRLGLPLVVAIGLIFLAIFLVLGAALTAIAHRITDDRRPVALPRGPS